MWKAELSLPQEILLGWNFPVVCREMASTSWVFHAVHGVIHFVLGMQNKLEAEQTYPVALVDADGHPRE